MTDETDMSREAVERWEVTHNANGLGFSDGIRRSPHGGFVTLEDYRALLARAEAAEAERDEWHSDFRALEKAVVGDTGLSAMTVALQARKYRPRAEAAEAELHNERARVLALESELAALTEMHKSDMEAGAALEAKLAAAREALIPFASYVDKRTGKITMVWEDGKYRSVYTDTLKPRHFFEAHQALSLLDADAPARPAPVTAEEVEQRIWLYVGEYLAGQDHSQVSPSARRGIERAIRRALAGEKGDG